MLKKIYILFLPLYFSTALQAQDAYMDTFSANLAGGDTLTLKRITELNEKIKRVNKIQAEKANKHEISKQTGRLIASGCLLLMIATVLVFRHVNRDELKKEKESMK